MQFLIYFAVVGSILLSVLFFASSTQKRPAEDRFFAELKRQTETSRPHSTQRHATKPAPAPEMTEVCARDGNSYTRCGSGCARNDSGYARCGNGCARNDSGCARRGSSSARDGNSYARNVSSCARCGSSYARDDSRYARDGNS